MFLLCWLSYLARELLHLCCIYYSNIWCTVSRCFHFSVRSFRWKMTSRFLCVYAFIFKRSITWHIFHNLIRMMLPYTCTSAYNLLFLYFKLEDSILHLEMRSFLASYCTSCVTSSPLRTTWQPNQPLTVANSIKMPLYLMWLCSMCLFINSISTNF